MLTKLKECKYLFNDPKINEYFTDKKFVQFNKTWIDYFLSPDFFDKYVRLPKYYVHRDLNTGNIIINSQGAFLIDWDYILIDSRLADMVAGFGFFGIEERQHKDKPPTYHPNPNNVLEKANYFIKIIEQSPYKMTSLEKELFPQIAILSYILDTFDDLNYYMQGRISLENLQSKTSVTRKGMQSFIKKYHLESPPVLSKA